MATADEYAAWIVKNADKKGTPAFETVAAAYKDARSSAPTQEPTVVKPTAQPSEIPALRKGFLDALSAPFEMGMELSQKPRAEQAAFIAPAVEALGAGGGGIIGSAVGPAGAVAGAGAGYAGAKELLRHVAGTAAPETLPQAAQRVGETALTGATLEAGGRGLMPYVGKMIEPIAKYARKLSDIKASTYIDAVEGKGKDILNALTSKNATITPGSVPTAGEVAAPVGSTKFSAFQQKLKELPETATEYAANAAQTNQARRAQDARVADRYAKIAATVKAKIDRGLVDVSPTDIGNTLTSAAKVARQDVKTNLVQPAYKAAFDAAGDAKIDVSKVVADAETILGRKLSSFATETAPDTVRKLLSFKLAIPEAEAVAIGKAGFKSAKPPAPPAPTPEATLQQLDDVRKAINADIAAASTSNAPMAATTLRNLRQLHSSIDDAIGKSTTLPDTAKTAYTDAVNIYRTQYAPRFKEGVNAELFKRTSLAEGKVRPEDVINKYFTPNGESEARQFNELFGKDPNAVTVARAGIEDVFRKKVVDAATGEVNPTKLANFMRDHGRSIDIFDAGGMNLKARLNIIAKDAQRLAQIEAAAKASGNKLSPPLPPGVNALAVEKNIANLTRGMTPRQLTAINAVRDDLARELEFKALATAGGASEKFIGGLATATGKESGVAPLPTILSIPITVYNNVVKRLLGVVDQKLAMEIAREMTNPAVAAKSIKSALERQAQHTSANKLIGGVASKIPTSAVSVQALPSDSANQNALAP